MAKNLFDSTILLRFDKTKVAKEKFYGAKKPIKIWDIDVNNIAISKFVKTKNNSKYFIGYLDEVLRPFSGYVKTFEDKSGDRNKNNKLMLLHTDHDKLLEKYKTIWTKIDNLKNIELNVLPVYDDRYIKTKIRT